MLRVVVKEDHLPIGDGLQVCLHVFRSPVFPVVVEQPPHLEPYGLRVCGGKGLIGASAYPCKGFRVPGRGVDLVEKVHSVYVVRAEKPLLRLQEFLLHYAKKGVRRG